MAWIHMILVAFCLSPGIHANFANETTEARSGHQRAKDYIWNQRDETTGFWPREEVISAVLGVLTDVTGYKGLLSGEQIDIHGTQLKSEEDQNSQSQIVAQNFERIHTDFLMKLNNAKGDLGEIEDQYLGQLAMVLGVTCLHDPKEYFGHNLIEELYQRALSMISKDELTEDDFRVQIQFPGLLLALCQLQDFRITDHLGFGTFTNALVFPAGPENLGRKFPQGLERAAMNSLAASCLAKSDLRHDSDFGKIKEILGFIILHNLRYINSIQEEDGGFETLHGTSLALYAHSYSDVKFSANSTLTYSQPRTDEALKWLMDAQKPDGSFGSSLTFTSLASLGILPDDVLFKINEINRVDCNGEWANKQKTKIRVEFKDAVHSKTTFEFRFPAEIDDNFMSLLEEYSRNNPKALQLNSIPVGEKMLKVTEINGLKDDDRQGNGWKAYKVLTDGTTQKIRHLRVEEISDMDIIYRFEYS